MKGRMLLGLGLLALGAGVAPVGCGGTDLPVLKDGASDLGVLDAGTGKCGANACADGELCCAGADEYCSPTCMKVDRCPAYARPCREPDAGSGDSGVGDASAPLQWYWTCGDPVCHVGDGGTSTSDIPGCAAAGTACGAKGETCGTHDSNVHCGATLVCDDHDPTSLGCPISSKKFKDDIAYVDRDELQRLHDETLKMRLATYRYKGPYADPNDPSATKLGFIIEDQPQSLSVDRGHDRVDMYGYLSMTVATMQVQEKEIATLKREMAELRASCGDAKKR